VAVGTQLPQNQNYFYDAAGNLSRDDGFDGSSADGFVYGYDVENRLTQVQYDGGGGLTMVAAYRYDALGWRIEYTKYNDAGTAVLSRTRYCYDGQNVVSEYNYTPGGGGQPGTETQARTYVNGSQYIDERVVMRNYTGEAPRTTTTC